MPPSIDKSVDDSQEVYLKNPTYEGNRRSEKPATDEVGYETVAERSDHQAMDDMTYDTVVLPGRTELENDDTYAVPDQEKHWQGEGTHIL